jgi:hypothetical protein
MSEIKGTIITHGKGAWGRANRHKRIDADIEAELHNTKSTPSKVILEHADVIQKVMEVIEPGQTIFTQVQNTGLHSIPETPISIIEHGVKTIQKANPIRPALPHKSEEIVKLFKESVVINSSDKISTKNHPELTVSIEKKKKTKTKKPKVQFIEDISDFDEKLKLLNS